MCMADYVPFTYYKNGEGIRVDFKGIAQALVVAAIVGMAVMYSDQSKMIERLDSISNDVEQIRRNQIEFRKDFYAPRK